MEQTQIDYIIQNKGVRRVNKIIVHCSATRARQNIGYAEIQRWHINRGFAECGYHFIIRRSGEIETGRALHKTGAHCLGQNTGSIGICLVGGVDEKGKKGQNNFNTDQLASLDTLLATLMLHFKLESKDVYGHRDFDNKKECPSFEIQDMFKKD
jgi:N-acetylmuramoyl-L-alanine amidase